ncbi:MAG: M20/M25/M40 family metallo-hydrolase [Blastocatellia bacterium]
MKKILGLMIVLLLIVPLSQSHGQEADLRSANEAWLEGKYADALRTYLRLVKSPAGDQLVETIARQTGELFQTSEITTDGNIPKMNADGNVVAYETGAGMATVTRLVSTAERSLLAELSGTGAAFSPSGKKVAYLKLPQNDEFKKAQAAFESAQGVERFAAQQTRNFIHAKHATIVVRDLASKQEIELPTNGLLKSSLVFGADDDTVYFTGAREGETTRNEIYSVKASGQAVAVTNGEGFKIQPSFDASGKLLIYAVPLSTPFPAPRPLENAQGNQANQGGGRPQGGGGIPGAVINATKFGVMELASRKTTVINGTMLTPAADGSAVAYLTRSGQETTLTYHPIGGEAVAVLKTTERLESPAFAPDGQRLIYSKMPRADWELFAIGRDGKNEIRLTREIQHDILPRFLTNDRALGMIGEARHRRAYFYDLTSGARIQLFHNNTVRTISPEYIWQPSADGSKLMIQADRDGDTVSPERGVYVVDLNRKVTKAELIARLEKQLATETALMTEGQRIFAPIAAEVRRVLEPASVNRAYEHEKALFDFDSKHITKPGNKLAADYLLAAYKSFGLEAEQQCFENRAAVGGKTCNVIATLKGTENPELVYVVGSHFDSVPVGPGSDDDTSGTVALLEAARMLAKHPQAATIIFASYTGEESGLLGSREFVRTALANKMKIAGVLNNDMIGWANDNRMDNTIRYSNDGIRDIEHAAASLFTRLITYDARWHRGTDATAYYEAYGDIVGGIGSYPVLGNPHYHQATDMLDTINHQQVVETGKTTAATMMMLASSPARLKDLKVERYDGSTAEITWTASPEKSVNGYLVSYDGAKPVKVSAPRLTLKSIKPGTIVSVKAVNARGLEGWDWARVTVKAK